MALNEKEEARSPSEFSMTFCKPSSLLLIWLFSMLMVPAFSAHAYTNTASVFDCSGLRATNGMLTHISAGGQPGGVLTANSEQIASWAGFLNTFFLYPELDTDGNGLPNEVDMDNDGDTLADADEIHGLSFDPTTQTDPNLTDTDDDGINDWAESVAGTDPTDPDAKLVITQIARGESGMDLSWSARKNETYKVWIHDDPVWTSQWTVVDTVTVTNTGSGPWQVVTNTWTDTAPTAPARFYKIEVAP